MQRTGEDPEEREGCQPPDPPPEDDPCKLDKVFIGQLGEGELCTSGTSSLECAPGLKCLGNGQLGVDGQCVRPGQLGEPCISDEECDEELYCELLESTCQRYRKEGETCVYYDREAPAPRTEPLVECDPDLHLDCDPVTDTCVAKCERGASCATDDDCDEEQDPDLHRRTLRPAARRGLPCDVNDDCQEGLRCAPDPADPTERICELRLQIGEDCTVHEDCDSEFCDPSKSQCSPTNDPRCALPEWPGRAVPGWPL